MWWHADEDERARVLEALARLEERRAQRLTWLPGPYAMDTAELRAEVAFTPKGQRYRSVLAELADRERALMTPGGLRDAIARTEAAIPQARPGDRPWIAAQADTMRAELARRTEGASGG
jgi:hypothetical protein